MPDAEASKHADALLPQSIGIYDAKVPFTAFSREGWRGRCKYIATTQDRAVPFPLQQKMVQRFGLDIDAQIEAGHSPFLSKPAETADHVVACINGVSSSEL